MTEESRERLVSKSRRQRHEVAFPIILTSFLGGLAWVNGEGEKGLSNDGLRWTSHALKPAFTGRSTRRREMPHVAGQAFALAHILPPLGRGVNLVIGSLCRANLDNGFLNINTHSLDTCFVP